MRTFAHHAICFGVRFNPTPAEAISLYLRRWAVGQPLPDTAGIVHEAEVYKYDPKDLAAVFPRLPKTENRFFFTTCKRHKAGRGYRMSRAAGAGSWVSNDKTNVENSDGEKIGYRERLRYTYKNKSRQSDWLMDEYHLDEPAVVGGDQERVLCRIYPKAGSASAAGDLGLGVPEPMAAAAVQQPVAPVFPAITQPREISKQALRPRVTVPTPVAITPQAPKRPAPQLVTEPTGPNAPKRMRFAAALPPLQVPPPGPRHLVVGWNTTKQPNWLHAPALPQAPTTTHSLVAAPSRPAAEAPTNEMDVNAELDMPPPPVEEGQGIIQEEASNDEDDDLVNWLERELPHDEQANDIPDDHGIIQEEAGFVGQPQEEHAACRIQDDEEEGQHHHTRSLQGLVVDETGDENVVAQDFFDGIEDIADPNDGEDQEWACKPLSEYFDLPY